MGKSLEMKYNNSLMGKLDEDACKIQIKCLKSQLGNKERINAVCELGDYYNAEGFKRKQRKDYILKFSADASKIPDTYQKEEITEKAAICLAFFFMAELFEIDPESLCVFKSGKVVDYTAEIEEKEVFIEIKGRNSKKENRAFADADDQIRRLLNKEAYMQFGLSSCYFCLSFFEEKLCCVGSCK